MHPAGLLGGLTQIQGGAGTALYLCRYGKCYTSLLGYCYNQL